MCAILSLPMMVGREDGVSGACDCVRVGIAVNVVGEEYEEGKIGLLVEEGNAATGEDLTVYVWS